MTETNTSIPSSAKWTVSSCPLMWTQCGEEYIVFHRASGETHYLNDLSALILRLLEREPDTTHGIHQELIDMLGVSPGVEVEQQIDSLLARFEQLGVVGRVFTTDSDS